MIKIGIIGCGKIAQVRHIPGYYAHPDATIHSFCDFSAPRAREMAQKYGGATCTTWQEIISNPEIHAVSVLTSNSTHAEITVAALNSGKHVLCEKPMATTLPECEAMVNAAKQSGKYLMIGQSQRFADAHQKAHKLIQQGAIGDIITFQTTFGHSGADNWSIDGASSWFFDKQRAVFGAMGDLGIHKTDLIHYLTGQRVQKVSAQISTLNKKDAQGNLIQVDDNAICLYTLTSGAMGTMSASWTHYGTEDNSTVLCGTKGIMSIYKYPEAPIVIDHADGTRTLHSAEKIMTNSDKSTPEPTRSPVIDEFIACIKENRQPNISGEEAIHAMKAVFAAMQSSETGQTVCV